MKTIADLLLPELNDNTVLSVSISYLEALTNILPNYYYEVINETTHKVKSLISIQIIIIKNTSAEYFLIVNESSTVDRWTNQVDMQNYFDMRLQNLESNKRKIYVTSSWLDEDNFLLQYYLFAGQIHFEHISALATKIVDQIRDFRNNYKKEN